MIVYCRNNKCPNAVSCPPTKLEKQQDWEEHYNYVCSANSLLFMEKTVNSARVSRTYPVCQQEPKEIGGTEERFVWCDVRDCVYNLDCFCDRKTLEINKTKDNIPYCRNYSLIGFRGHMDWSRFPTSKESHIDDDYSEKLEKDNKIFKSFPDHPRADRRRPPKRYS